ncbi:MAG: alpha/beta fold hydrolase [Alphaproteobacteria bacterium]
MNIASPLPENERLAVRAPAPDWFHRAVGTPRQSRRVTVEGCQIHYLLWSHAGADADAPGLLLVHGGGAHANWWSFIAPFLARRFRVAAMDLSGMGDSGTRPHYDATLRAAEMLAVCEDSGLGRRPFVVGHSFGGYMLTRMASLYGDRLGGAVIVDTPIRSPEEAASRPLPRRRDGPKRIYPDFEDAVARFRLLPTQDCANAFIVEHIARHSLKAAPGGWEWKFDNGAMGPERFTEPFSDYLRAATCRRAYIHGARSALVTPATVAWIAGLMGPAAPVIEIPEAQHHIMLDQPLAFVAALNALLEAWLRDGHD